MPAVVRDGLFGLCLIIALLFHLSMITLFSIVVVFPTPRSHYYACEIVNAPPTAVSVARLDGDMDLLGGKGLLGVKRPLDLNLDVHRQPALPEITLPELHVGALDISPPTDSERNLKARYEELFPPHSDSWARMVRELRGLASELTGLKTWDLARAGAEDEELRSESVVQPAEGIKGTIEWMSEPKDRKLLVAPQATALLSARPAKLEVPVSLVITVSAGGEVLEVLSPPQDEGDFIGTVAEALKRYRFAPLEAGDNRNQRATLVLRSAESAP